VEGPRVTRSMIDAEPGKMVFTGTQQCELTSGAAATIIVSVRSNLSWRGASRCSPVHRRLLHTIRSGTFMSAASDEAKLVALAQRGDRSAIAEIYERHHSAIYRYVYYRVGDTATAEDLTGTVFVRVVEHLDGFVYQGRPLLSWLYTIARNVVVDHRRRTSGRTIVPLDESLVTGALDVERAAERALVQRQLAAALNRLTEEQRQVILLKFIEEMSNEEVADVLGKTVGAVKSLQHRALASLHRVLSTGAA
jgi:RNA polymerase sigma-70 factor (ECF subfamily)